MKISINALKQIYAQAKVPDFLPKDINKIAQKIGAQLGEIEEIVDLGRKYQGIVVAKVVSCEKHPDADKLKLCKIDVGKSDLVQVVCGAPNVKEGMLAAWLPPGTTVPATLDKEPLVLEARPIRGQTSNGMLASASELGISEDHSGILTIDKEAKPGSSFAELYKLDDFIIDIENKMFTHRPDCFGLLGIARELAGIYERPFTSPDWYAKKPKIPKAESELKLEVTNEIPQLVPRFCMAALSDVKIGPSPLWLQVALFKAGIKAVNNIVDLTNFYMYYTGQPLHAYDYDKVSKLSGKTPVVKVRRTKAGEKLKLLNGKEVSILEGDIMIATDKHPIGIGGVIGGADTEVDSSTKNIILECANFDGYSIRRSSMNHGIFTEAVTRFTKGQSPHQNPVIIAKVISDAAFLAGGKLASDLVDIKGKVKANKPISITPEFINSRLGLKLTGKQISSILQNVEFSLSGNSQLNITAPFWRTDIKIPEDIVEEVGRLYGYDRLPLTLPKKTMSASVVSDELRLKQELREKLSALGANEVLSYSFVHGDLLENAGQNPADSFKLKNALSPELQYYRQSLTPNLLEKVHPNIKAGFSGFALFELGRVHIKGKTKDGLPEEFSRLSLVVAAKKNQTSPAFYTAKKYLAELLSVFDIDADWLSFDLPDKHKDSSAVYYEPGRSASIKLNGEIIGRIGEYSQKVSAALKLPEFCAGFEIGLAPLQKLSQAASSYKPLSRYPGISQDITLKTSISTSYSQIQDALSDALRSCAPKDVSCKTECLDIFSADQKSKNTSFRIVLTSYKRTLATENANALLDEVSASLGKSIKADRV